jgi:uncharacterized NAD(P)/FAD-binding protein YdhS
VIARVSAAALAAVVIASVALVPPAAAAADPAAKRAAVAAKRAELAHRWDDLWRLLHPAQRRFIPRATFVGCYRHLHRIDPTPRSISVVAASAARVRVPGARSLPVRSARITLEVTYARAPSQRAETLVAASADRWYWTTSAPTLAQFKRLTFCA